MAEMLFCSICDIYTHIDNFSTKQAKLESNDVNGGSVFRFCLKHTSGDQRDWIAKLKHRAAREYSIVDNAERLRERQQTLAKLQARLDSAEKTSPRRKRKAPDFLRKFLEAEEEADQHSSDDNDVAHSDHMSCRARGPGSAAQTLRSPPSSGRQRASRARRRTPTTSKPLARGFKVDARYENKVVHDVEDVSSPEPDDLEDWIVSDDHESTSDGEDEAGSDTSVVLSRERKLAHCAAGDSDIESGMEDAEKIVSSSDDDETSTRRRRSRHRARVPARMHSDGTSDASPERDGLPHRALRLSVSKREQRRTSLEKLAQARERSQRHRSPDTACAAAASSAGPSEAGQLSRGGPDALVDRSQRHCENDSDSDINSSDSGTPGGVLDAHRTRPRNATSSASFGKHQRTSRRSLETTLSAAQQRRQHSLDVLHKARAGRRISTALSVPLTTTSASHVSPARRGSGHTAKPPPALQTDSGSDVGDNIPASAAGSASTRTCNRIATAVSSDSSDGEDDAVPHDVGSEPSPLSLSQIRTKQYVISSEDDASSSDDDVRSAVSLKPKRKWRRLRMN
eukprot:m.408424 g.408424  ORF g.408424 m.408424 type:complete len:568 (-) comp21234_c0_seq12:251-1954(-)